MMAGMTTKIAVSLPDEQVEAARAAVAEGRAPSVSAYVSEALSRRSAEDELLLLLEQDEARHPSTPEHLAWARRALGVDAPAADEPPGDEYEPVPARKRVAGRSSIRALHTGRPSGHHSTDSTGTTRRK